MPEALNRTGGLPSATHDPPDPPSSLLTLLDIYSSMNALAETIIGLSKTELIYPRGPWCSLEDVELATLEWVWWFNHHRLLEPIGYVPPVEYEEPSYRRQAAPPNL